MVIVPAAGVEGAAPAATERVGHEDAHHLHHRGMTVDEMTVGRLHQLSHLSHLNHLQDGVHPHGHFAAAGPPRGASRFMITDILSGGSPSGSSPNGAPPSAVAGASASARSPCSSPGGSSSDGPRDLSLHCREGDLSDGHESGTDSGLPGETSSVCSNGHKDDDKGSGGLTKKQRKARTAFTDHQLQTLEKSFERQKYLSVQDRMELAAKLSLTDTQVKTWYQNRRAGLKKRMDACITWQGWNQWQPQPEIQWSPFTSHQITKWKRQTAVGLELLAEAGNYAAFQRLYGAPPYSCWPYPGAAGAGSGPAVVPPSTADLYYRQAAAAAAAVSTLQKPLPYRLYPGGLGLGLPGPSAAAPSAVAAAAAAAAAAGLQPPPPGPLAGLGTLAASSSLSSLSSYYNAHHSAAPPPRSPTPEDGGHLPPAPLPPPQPAPPSGSPGPPRSLSRGSSNGEESPRVLSP